MVFESSDRLPDHTTTFGPNGRLKRGSWSSSKDAFTLRGARRAARKLLEEYIDKNPKTAALIGERYARRLRRDEEEALVLPPLERPGPASLPSALSDADPPS